MTIKKPDGRWVFQLTGSMATVGMNRLLRSVAALTVSAPRARLVRAASTQTAAMPSNLSLAKEKPMPPPRVIPAAQDVTVLPSGDLELQLLSLSEDSQELGTIVMNREVFGAPDRVDILQRVVRWQLACRRAGTNKTKTRSEVSGSTRKPWKQKGSGRARVGDIRAPQWRGGYRVHGPVLRDFSYNLPKKVRAMGLRVALSTKLREGKLAVVDSLDIDVRWCRLRVCVSVAVEWVVIYGVSFMGVSRLPRRRI